MEAKKFEFLSELELLSLEGDQDCCYCSASVTASRDHISKRHLRFAIHYTDGDTRKFSIPCQCSDRQEKSGKRSHWHCSRCGKLILRSFDFKVHLKRHGLMVVAQPSDDGEPCVDTTDVDPVQKGNLFCKKCGIHFTNTSNYKRHERQQHGRQEPMICIDSVNGMYVTTKESHGMRLPIHVQKSSVLKCFGCEVETCMDYMSIAANSGNPGKECFHLERTKTATSYSPPATLRTESLQEMIEKGLFSTSRREECTALNNKACSEDVDCVFPIFWGEHGLSERYLYFSVYTGQKDNWCRFGRTVCTFDTTTGKWHCRCRGTKHKIGCVHRFLCMWWLFQEHPHLLQNAVDTTNEEIEDIEEKIVVQNDIHQHFVQSHSAIITQTNYLWRSKRIPEDLPTSLTTEEKPIPEFFEPREEQCPYCPGPTAPDLQNQILITRQATVYGIFKQFKGVSVYAKECPVCKNLVRFQDYESGFHNYNNKVFLSIPLCSLLTAGLSNHIAVGRLFRTIESHSKSTLPLNTLRKAFYHFSALRQYSYNYFCYRCGYHPSSIIADTNWKVAFDLPVNLLRRPDIENVGPQDTHVNAAARWENLEKEIIANGLCDDSSNNPFTSPLTYSAFAPWIGPRTRIDDKLPKTEVYKGLSQSERESSVCRERIEVDEDQILQILDSKSPKREDLVKACSCLGVSTTGSKTDLINRLEELLLYKEVYPKMFVKLKKAGGGVLHMGCTHGVVYYTSPLWWQESARDHGDALLSFKYAPTVYISDIAGRVARHVNNRTQQRFFQPHEGRVCAPTDNNISLAAAGKLTVNLEWLKNIRRKLRNTDESKQTDRFSCPHPETGTADRYSLYDRFHQKNQKRPEERLRSLKLVPDLASWINSSVAEQINRELSSSRYSLCQMKDVHYMFSLRLFFHLHNERLNGSFMKQMEKQSTSEAINIGLNGKLMCGKTETHTRKTDQQSRNPQGTATGDNPTVDCLRFSVAMFPINEQNKEKISQIYAVEKTENKVIARISPYAVLELRDLKTICPPGLVKDTSIKLVPWLSDNVVNCRVAQIAADTQNVIALTTDTFILWHRHWMASKQLPDSDLKILKNDAQRVLLPRIVGAEDTHEIGFHFILWVFDKTEKEIRIYDNTGHHIKISTSDMEILKDAFRGEDSLDGWTVCNPQQWNRNDGNNCGVFVCTMAEMEAKGLSMSSEQLHREQLIHLRVYHASCLVKDMQTKDFPPKLGTCDAKNRCLAQELNVCVFQQILTKTMYPDVKKLKWIQCDLCSGWLHYDCAGINPAMVTEDMVFSCGCDIEKSYPFEKTLSVLKEEMVVNIMEDQEILDLHNGLTSGMLRSNRMFLNKHPTYSPKLKMQLDERISFFNERQTEGIIERIKKVTELDMSELNNTSYVLEVLTPELTLLILKKTEGFHRFQGEMALQTRGLLETSSDSDPEWF